MNRFFSILFPLLIGLGLSGCGGGNSWHQKLTVNVMTPQGEVSGSSVSEVNIRFSDEGAWLAAGYAYQASQRGEAVVVEVSAGRYLFALIEEQQQRMAFAAYLGPQQSNPTSMNAKLIQAMKQSVALDSDLYPLLVTFGDINDPKSVKKVDPHDLAASFGAGYSLKSLSLEITDEPVTEGKVEALLLWIGDHKGRIKPTTKLYEKDLTAEEKIYRNAFLGG